MRKYLTSLTLILLSILFLSIGIFGFKPIGHWRLYPVDPSCVLYLPFYKYGAEQTKIWDISGNANHGTITETVPYSSGLGWYFDGTNDYINCGTGTSLQFGTNPFSVLIWIKSGRSGEERIAGKINADGGATESFYFIQKAATNKFAFYAGSENANSNVAINDNIWHCLAGTRASTGTIVAYIDGMVKTTTAGSNLTVNATGGFSIGRHGAYDGDYFQGLVGETFVFNRALSAQEIINFYELTRRKYGI